VLPDQIQRHLMGFPMDCDELQLLVTDSTSATSSV